MDPVSLLLNAVVAGAAAALKPAAEKTVKEAYEGLRQFIKSRWSKLAAGIDFLEGDPASPARRAAVEESLKKAVEADAPDERTLAAARSVMAAVARDRASAQAAQAAGVLIEDLQAGASVDITRIVAGAGGATVRKIRAEQDIRIGEVIAEEVAPANPPRRQ